jgi:two-component system, LytTR family, sensor kinase
MQPSGKNKILKYFPFFILWLFVTICMTLIYLDGKVSPLPQLLATSLGTALTIPLSWYAATKMVPRYLYQKKISPFIWRISYLTIINVIVVYLIIASTYHVFTGKPILRPPLIMVMITFLQLFVNLIFISIGCGVKIITDRYSLEARLLETEKEKISAELNFLRSQINPHFLFNVLNTIYFQIDKSNLAARNSVEKFSEMLRYQLYDCNNDKIEINKEIEYIKSYVAMQSQRLEAGTDIKLNTGSRLNGFAIAPFMLLTLIENAFKHISHFKNPEENKITIDIQNNEQEKLLMIKVSNTFDKEEKVQHLQQSGGMGIQNLKRRLELLYPSKAQLSVHNNDRTFESLLNLNYHD